MQEQVCLKVAYLIATGGLVFRSMGMRVVVEVWIDIRGYLARLKVLRTSRKKVQIAHVMVTLFVRTYP